jgi:hypothetical protein
MTTSKKVFVPAGDVVISSGADAFRIQKIQFIAEPDYARPVTEGRYGTICLEKAGVMTGATLYEIAYYEASSKKIFFDEIIDGTMVAGMPYIFLPNEDVEKLGVFYTANTIAAAKTDPAETKGLIGYIGASEETSDALAIPAGEGNYILSNNQYREVVTANTGFILSHRAYIKLASVPNYADAPAPGRRRISMSVQGSQVATGMDNIDSSETPMKVLIDGKMYIIRGEKMFDATGKLVK